MGFFSEIANEARRGVAGSQAQTAVRQTVITTPLALAAPEPAPALPVAAPAAQPEPAPEAAAPAPPVPAPETAAPPAEAKQEPMLAPETAPPPELKLDAAEDAAQAPDDDAKRKAHEAAEAKRKAEFDAMQAKKKAARQKQLDKIAAMDSAELLAASVERVAADTERLTRRNMKEAVAEHIQAKCREDAAFAMLVMDPIKSMVNCFRYINRKAREYAEQEMKDNGIEHRDVYGLDVPDGLVYQWAEDYFRDENAEEDHKNDEKFVPKPYVPASANRKKTKGKTAKKPSGAAKPKAEKPSESSGMEQISLM